MKRIPRPIPRVIISGPRAYRERVLHQRDRRKQAAMWEAMISAVVEQYEEDRERPAGSADGVRR